MDHYRYVFCVLTARYVQLYYNVTIVQHYNRGYQSINIFHCRHMLMEQREREIGTEREKTHTTTPT